MGIPRGSHTHWTRRGTPKETFETIEDAQEAAERLLACDMQAGRFMTFPRAYECEVGGHYHVGNTH